MAKMGRPRIEINWELLDQLCSHRMYLRDCSEILKVSEDTIENRIKEKTGKTFSEYRNKKMAPFRNKLVKKALDMALKDGDRVMLIFCLKNYCGWTDNLKDRNEAETNSNLIINYEIASKDGRNSKS